MSSPSTRTSEPPAKPTGDGRGYSIRVASRLTGIPAETLRMWERRYGFPAPGRGAGGVRSYTDDDVERLRVVARALKAGYRVGEVIDRDRGDLEAALGATRHLPPVPVEQVPGVESLIDALARDDHPGVRTELRRAALALGPRRFVTDLAGPLCTAVGEAWARGDLGVRHEHVLAAALSAQLRILHAAYEDTERPPVVVLATLPGEAHGLGLDMVALYLASQAATTRVLGPDLPIEQTAEAARALSADVIGISVSAAADVKAAGRNLRRLLRALPRRCRVWAGGAGAAELDVTDELLELVPTWDALDRAITSLRR